MAADANIVMFERIKEEMRAGRSIPAAISSGYSKALRTIIDANVVTIGVAFILFTLATAGIKGFAFTLGIGTIVSLFTAVLATSAILGAMARSRVLSGRARSASGGSAAAGASTSWASRAGSSRSPARSSPPARSRSPGSGSTSASTSSRARGSRRRSSGRPASSDVRDTLGPLGYSDAKIQEVDDPELGQRTSSRSPSPQLEPQQVNKVEQALDSDFGVKSADFSASSIGPTFGEQIARTAVIAIIASLLLISIYIGVRFEFKFAVPVLIALAHDLLITTGVYALTDREVTTSTVAALLTILGYSLYDTVIVFDRIRENVPRMPRATFSQIANRSMSEVFTRSLATSFVVLMPVGSLMLFGGETLQGLRLRAARGRGLRRLLVDLHRHPGAGRVEGARARLHAPPPPGDGGERRRRAPVRLGDDRCESRMASRPTRAPAGRPGRPPAPARVAASSRAGSARATAVAPPPVEEADLDEADGNGHPSPAPAEPPAPPDRKPPAADGEDGTPGGPDRAAEPARPARRTSTTSTAGAGRAASRSRSPGAVPARSTGGASRCLSWCGR